MSGICTWDEGFPRIVHISLDISQHLSTFPISVKPRFVINIEHCPFYFDPFSSNAHEELYELLTMDFPSYFSFCGKKWRWETIGEETLRPRQRLRQSYSYLSPSPSFDVVLTFGANFPIKGGRAGRAGNGKLGKRLSRHVTVKMPCSTVPKSSPNPVNIRCWGLG